MAPRISLRGERDTFERIETRDLESAIRAEHVVHSGISSFEQMPISRFTILGLRESNFSTPTTIQRAVLPYALRGHDVMGSAKTGSGKTVAYLIPVIEKLYRLHSYFVSTLGGMVISPTRELTVQIFKELMKLGGYHKFSYGLLVGGKKLSLETSKLHAMNILVCTPGRVLQHMDSTPNFDTSSVSILVLDEADRMLEAGFSHILNAIFENLPLHRQTLMFSATQKRKAADLARVVLHDPKYISVHAKSISATPLRLQQAYLLCELWEKVDFVWNFIKSHARCRMIVFLATCKQVMLNFEIYRKLCPDLSLRCLHSKMKYSKRIMNYEDFCQPKSMVLFATDVASRGLDFKDVDWIVQADCPESVEQYIHRVGRTARHSKIGRALLLLTPTEKDGMMRHLAANNIPIRFKSINRNIKTTIVPALQNLISGSSSLKALAKAAVISYVNAIFLMKDKSVFKSRDLPLLDFALSMGLSSMPGLSIYAGVRSDDDG